jgi:hypothetical protein
MGARRSTWVQSLLVVSTGVRAPTVTVCGLLRPR